MDLHLGHDAPAGARMHLLRRRSALVLSLALSLGACAVGPNFKRPTAPEGAGYTPKPLAETTASAPVAAGGDAERFVMGRDISFAWWKEFGSPKLDALVEKALANNPQLPAAQAALRQAQEMTKAQRGYFYPTVGLDFQPTRQQLPGNTGGNAPGLQGDGTYIVDSPNRPYTYNWYTAQVMLSYTPDIFGANRRQVESLKAQAESLRFQMEATYVTLADNVVAAVIQEASLNDQIEATKRYIDENEQGLKVLQDQFRSGYAGRLDLAAQELALAQAKAMLPPLVKQLEQTHDLIRALAGSLPNDDLDMTFSLASLNLPRELPVSLSGQLIEQRPDVRAAEAQLHSASAQVGVAVAARLPQFTIAAAAGGTANEVSWLFGPGGPFWSLAGDVNQTVFDGGTLRHHQHVAEQGLIQARAQYKSTVITAFQGVADTLHAIQSDADALKAVVDAETAAKTTLDITRRQYQAGYVNYLTLLAAQGAYEQALIVRVQAQTNRYGDAATLFQALGGGWWNRNAQARAESH
jgi:NodT family efflux transporter outer membrane factor (OMF) lipoprotein